MSTEVDPAEGLSSGPATASGERPPLASDRIDALIEVLDEIRLGRAGSRSELVDRTGLGRNVVAQRVGELLERGLAYEGDEAPSTGGRRARRLHFNADAGHLLVADLGATGVNVAVTALDGRILARQSEAIDVASGPAECLRRIDTLFRSLPVPTGVSGGRLWGIGISLPGPVEFRTGRPIAPPIMPGWDRYPVRESFENDYRAPVWVDNDVNVAALGEWRAGSAVGHDNVVHVKVGTGIGAGIISDGRLHRGAQGAAGDIGHIAVSDSPSTVCRCGNIGCLEALAGGAALARDGEAAAREGRSELLRGFLDQNGRVTAGDVAAAAAFGDPVATAMIEQAGRWIGLILASIVNFFNPSLIVIGGGVSIQGDRLLAAIRGQVYRRSLPLATRDLVIQQSSLGDLAGVIGAASMVADQLFSRESYARWADVGDPSGMPEVATRPG